MHTCSIAMALTVLASCAPDAGAPRPEADSGSLMTSAEQFGRPPVLSGIPRWSVEDPAPPFDLCFGQGVAAGDLDGDGFRDVIVAEGPCGLDPATQGRIAI